MFQLFGIYLDVGTHELFDDMSGFCCCIVLTKTRGVLCLGVTSERLSFCHECMICPCNLPPTNRWVLIIPNQSDFSSSAVHSTSQDLDFQDLLTPATFLLSRKIYLLPTTLKKCWNYSMYCWSKSEISEPFWAWVLCLDSIVCCRFYQKPGTVTARLQGLWTVAPWTEGHTRLVVYKFKTQDWKLHTHIVQYFHYLYINDT